MKVYFYISTLWNDCVKLQHCSKPCGKGCVVDIRDLPIGSNHLSKAKGFSPSLPPLLLLRHHPTVSAPLQLTSFQGPFSYKRQ